MNKPVHRSKTKAPGSGQAPARPRTISYIAYCDPHRSPGVSRKIKHTVRALKGKGYEANEELVSGRSFKGYWLLIRSVSRCRSHLLIIRLPGRMKMVALFPIILWKRSLGYKIVIDIPTPLISTLLEIWGSYRVTGSLPRMALVALFYPWVLWPAHRVLQYGQEHPWFLIGLKSKTLLVASSCKWPGGPKRRHIYRTYDR